ncbi:translesion error-prone DNA polymerase V autoproteolytic subunit [Pseudomonas sp. AB12(2023)]|uniref:LexA family protein n=1 Tax=Pseudomonas sp. AB12(2023) TaxID=3048597 RepID=UPI002B2392C7|nr:translesion error-prone DNA polymerase V autoproteolytic subunit [Pseudomonas sp. AB12(2023)]MEB0222181.1 translesion error-prone DNA polymerase V autoproteolytic subunit [Pseudomonas sp. AB12(2023)]
MNVTILGPLAEAGIQLPLYSHSVPAGFPSPAADHIEQKISLDELLNIRAPHMYLVRISGDSMQGAGIFDGDLAVVDKSIDAKHGHIVIGCVNNEPTCKRLCLRDSRVVLMAENTDYPARHILEGEEYTTWGVVTFSVRSHD